MAAFDELQRLIDILAETPRVTELSVMGPDGARITIRKRNRRPYDVAGAQPSSPPALRVASNPADDDRADRPETSPSVTVAANRVGTFHVSRPAIQIGDSVAKGQTVGYIESMKLMNDVPADVAGRIADQFVDEGLPVEYGQPLFVIAP